MVQWKVKKMKKLFHKLWSLEAQLVKLQVFCVTACALLSGNKRFDERNSLLTYFQWDVCVSERVCVWVGGLFRTSCLFSRLSGCRTALADRATSLGEPFQGARACYCAFFLASQGRLNQQMALLFYPLKQLFRRLGIFWRGTKQCEKILPIQVRWLKMLRCGCPLGFCQTAIKLQKVHHRAIGALQLSNFRPQYFDSQQHSETCRSNGPLYLKAADEGGWWCVYAEQLASWHLK